MAKTNAKPDYAAIVADAEKAVGAVKDPELKQAAFVKVLDTLFQRHLSRQVAAARPMNQR